VRNFVLIKTQSGSWSNPDTDAKESIIDLKPRRGFGFPVFSGKPRFKERFFNRHLTIPQVLVILGIFSGVFIAALFLLVPKFRETKAAQQPESSAQVASVDAKIKDEPNAKAKQPIPARPPKESRPQKEVAPTKSREDLFESKIAKKEFHIDPIEPLNPNRLHTGAAPLGNGGIGGRCVVNVINGTDTDALVRVIRIEGGEQLYWNFYILTGATFTAEKFPAGNYILKVAFGSDWGEAEKRFNYRRSFEKTERFTLDQTTTEFSILTLTLHKVINGNFHSSPGSGSTR
jgi:hypothetical protein